MNAFRRDRIGATRGKLAMIGMLAVVLVGVVASNFRGGADAAAVSANKVEVAELRQPPSEAAQAPASRTTTGADSPFGEFAVDRDWPDYSLDELVSFDPLAPPAWNAPTAATANGGDGQSTSIQELQAAQNAIILVSGNERIARIGSQEYRVGDKVGPYLITGISSAGIVLSDPAKGGASAR